MTRPKAGEMSACTPPYEATRIETANAARAPPNASSGIVYMLTLNADTAKMLSEIIPDAQAAEGASGTAAVASEITAAATQTRNRAGSAARPRSMNRSESHPPAAPPAAANTGGIQAYHAACTSVTPCTWTRNSVVQLVHSE